MSTDADYAYHKPVMLDEVLADLNIRPDGIYLDGTAGGGGHSREIARRLTSGGHLFSLDQDPDAVREASAKLQGLPAEVIHTNFTQLSQVLAAHDTKADGILLDLGVSSHELDDASRGFSYLHDGPLDMRMSQSGQTAADLVNNLPQDALANIIFRLGEEKYARSIAAQIAAARREKPITTTFQLADLIKKGVPAKARRDKNPCKRTFMALRIYLNKELECLEAAMEAAFESLNPGGRLVILTFHSLEDRMVKQAFAEFCTGCICPKEFPVCTCGRKPRGQLVHRKPVTASEAELMQNPRSRSAKLRSIEKIR